MKIFYFILNFWLAESRWDNCCPWFVSSPWETEQSGALLTTMLEIYFSQPHVLELLSVVRKYLVK